MNTSNERIGFLDPGESRAREVLRRRARLLAREVDATEKTLGMEVVVFELSDERYAIESAWVKEVVFLERIYPLPGLPRHVLGIINLRGEIVAMVDLGHLLGIVSPELRPGAPVLILRSPSMCFGIVAERLVGPSNLSLETLQPPPSHPEKGPAWLRGVTPDRLIFLDAKALLESEALIVS